MSVTEMGVCPVCHGTLRQDAGDGPYRNFVATYSASDNTIACQNCGGQLMFGKPTGRVPLRPDGTPCVHTYATVRAHPRDTHWQNVCTQCGHTHDLDSGD